MRPLVGALALALMILAGCTNGEPASDQPTSTTEPVVSTTFPTPTTAVPGLADLQGEWLLTGAPGLEDGLESTLTITDGTEQDDRYIDLELHGECIEILGYEFDGAMLTTAPYFGDTTSEGCGYIPEFAALFKVGSDLQTDIDGDTLTITAQGFTLGFERIEQDLAKLKVFIDDRGVALDNAVGVLEILEPADQRAIVGITSAQFQYPTFDVGFAQLLLERGDYRFRIWAMGCNPAICDATDQDALLVQAEATTEADRLLTACEIGVGLKPRSYTWLPARIEQGCKRS